MQLMFYSRGLLLGKMLIVDDQTLMSNLPSLGLTTEYWISVADNEPCSASEFLEIVCAVLFSVYVSCDLI